MVHGVRAVCGFHSIANDLSEFRIGKGFEFWLAFHFVSADRYPAGEE